MPSYEDPFRYLRRRDRGRQSGSRVTIPAPADGSFNPASLFFSGTDGAWYDPSDLTSLWADDGFTPAAVDGAIFRMDDKSGNARHLRQATAAARPILRKSGALYYLEFDGVDDWMVSAATYTVGPLPHYMAFAFSKAVQNTLTYFAATASGTLYHRIAGSGASNRIIASLRETTLGSFSATSDVDSVPLNTPVVADSLSVVGNSSPDIKINNNAQAGALPNNTWTESTSFTNAALGICAGTPTVGAFSSIRFYGGIVLRGAPSDRAAVATWLRRKIT
jgi:hypothetical protein